jgi:hypothetical protein
VQLGPACVNTLPSAEMPRGKEHCVDCVFVNTGADVCSVTVVFLQTELCSVERYSKASFLLH